MMQRKYPQKERRGARTCLCRALVLLRARAVQFLERKDTAFKEQKRKQQSPMLPFALLSRSLASTAHTGLDCSLTTVIARHVLHKTRQTSGKRTMAKVATIEATHVHKIASEGFSLQVNSEGYTLKPLRRPAPHPGLSLRMGL